MKNNLNQFINGAANSSPDKDLYVGMFEELALPYPSTKTTWFKKFDESVGGFRSKEFSILCGGTGVGKTALLANWSAALLEQQVPHFVASVETGHTDFLKRVSSVILDRDINRGQMISEPELKRIDGKLRGKITNQKLWLSLHDNRFSVHQLISDIAFHIQNHGIKIAMIDNLNFFLDVTSASESIVEMDRVLHELIIFCKKADVHVVMVMHPRKTDSERVESIYDIKGSSTAVQEAHNVFLWNRFDQSNSTVAITPKDSSIGDLNENHRTLKIAKMRRLGIAVGTDIVYAIPTIGGYRYQEVAIGRHKQYRYI